MADTLDPLPLEDVEDLRDLLALVARVDMEGLEVADLGALAGDDANAVVAAANAVFGLLDLLTQRDQEANVLRAARVRPPRTARVQASGSQLWGQRGRRN